MRQVDEPELIWIIMLALRVMPPSLVKQLAERRPEQRVAAERLVATRIAAGMARLEVMSDTPLPQGSNLFDKVGYGR